MSQQERRPNPWWVGVVSGMASYIDAAAIISFGTAIVILQHALGLEATQVGVASGALTFGIAIGALLGGKLGDRFGRRPVFTVTMLLIILGALLVVFSAGFTTVLIGALLVGLGTGADLPVSLSTISEAATDRNRGKLLGFSQILWFAGILVAIFISMNVGDLGRVGAQILFAHVAVVAGLVMLGRLTIPESPNWRAARSSGVDEGRVADLLRPPYIRPFLALVVFYSLINLSANTLGQFGTYLLVNVAGMDIGAASGMGLVFLPLGVIATLVFMAVVDGPRRFTWFTVGAVCVILGSLIPAVFGFSVTTFIVGNLVGIAGGAFAGEPIMKYWSQTQFPTLLRTTAQGAVIAIARLAAALMAGVTPLIIGFGAQVLYGFLSVVVTVGLLVAWLVFRKADQHDAFKAPLAQAAPSEAVA